ncbi:MAG: hypothetical protein IPF71_07015 [Rhodoferax sp.]|nr:hypothetical protein [Rhodoferax sp.]
MSSLRVDLSTVSGPVYSGRERGEALRRKYELDDKESGADVVDVFIPEATYTVSSSFFLGLFGPSVKSVAVLLILSVSLDSQRLSFKAHTSRARFLSCSESYLVQLMRLSQLCVVVPFSLGLSIACANAAITVSVAASGVPAEKSNNSSAPRSNPSVPLMVGSAPVIVASSKAASSASLKEVNSEEKPIDWWARVLAFLGILIGVFNLAFGYWKLSQDRRFSKEDDFWFRKIIAPATIEPMLKAVTSLLQDVPVKGSKD